MSKLMEKSIWTRPARLFFCKTWKNKKLCFSRGFLPFQSHLILSLYWRTLAGGPRFISTFFSFHSTLSHSNLSTDSTVNTLYLKRGHKLLEAPARLKWRQNWKLPILESHKSDRSRSIRNYQGRKQITPLSPNSFSTNVLFTCQNGDICCTPGIWQEGLEAFQSWSILWRRSRLQLSRSWIIKHFVCTLHSDGPQKCNTEHSFVSNWNKGQSLDFGIACYCPKVYWAYHLKSTLL